MIDPKEGKSISHKPTMSNYKCDGLNCENSVWSVLLNSVLFWLEWSNPTNLVSNMQLDIFWFGFFNDHFSGHFDHHKKNIKITVNLMLKG